MQNSEEIFDLHPVFVLERLGNGYLGVTTVASLGLLGLVRGVRVLLHGVWISCGTKRLCLSWLSDCSFVQENTETPHS